MCAQTYQNYSLPEIDDEGLEYKLLVMGKRYFCDYCNRSFLDDPDSRKKHLQGIVHIRARNSHYKKFKDLETILLEEKSKEECRRFRNSGECQFGENCNFTHYSPEDLANLQKLIEEKKREKDSHMHIAQASLDDWLRNRQSNVVLQTNETTEKKLDISHASFLPVSMQPIKEEHIIKIEFSEWG